MRDIALTIPFELIKAMICRCGQVQEMEAYELAIELCDITTAYRALFAVRPECERNYPAADIEESDVVFTILRTAVGLWPTAECETAHDGGDESVWLFERFDAVDGDQLYERYLRLADKINGTDCAEILT